MDTSKTVFYNEGYAAAFNDNKSKNFNPYPSTAEEWWKREDWEKGWVDGDTDFYVEATED